MIPQDANDNAQKGNQKIEHISLDLAEVPYPKQHALLSFRAELRQWLNTVYGSVEAFKSPQDFKGADIWNYVKNDLQHDFPITDARYEDKNKLMLLTDGYIQFEADAHQKRNIQQGNRYSTTTFIAQLAQHTSTALEVFQKDDYGLLSEGFPNYERLSVLALEFAPKDLKVQQNLLEQTWQQWWMELGAKSFSSLNQLNISALEGQVKNFVVRE